jgi:two-component system LytT family sensor kinase
MKTQRLEFFGITILFIIIAPLILPLWRQMVSVDEIPYLLGYFAVCYASLVIACIYLIPQLFQQTLNWSTALTIVLSISLTWVFLAFFNAEMVGQSFIRSLFRASTFWTTLFLYGIVAFYHMCKYVFDYAKRNPEHIKSRVMKEGVILVTLLLLFLLFSIPSNWAVSKTLILLTTYAYTIYALSFYWWIPHSDQNQFQRWQKILGQIGISAFVLLIFIQSYVASVDRKPLAFILGCLLLSVIILPLSHIWRQGYLQRKSQMKHLRQALGQTSADLKFLKSQINPHFLFNILNTLYGTALQENADRTAGSIQKLGDMMRFMLHENNEDKIFLLKEIEYLENYIELQQLRLVHSEDIHIQSNIHHIIGNHYIAPMLLIPFVENAFKHGIRLKRKSWIHMSLYQKEDQLHFDVRNSIHPKASEDPERDHSGIGLENVRQRLHLLYPGTHELIIRESPEEFYIHLNIPI